MPYGEMADAVVVLHVFFLAFVGLGGLLVWRWPGAAVLHVPALLWGAAMIGTGSECPLTTLEKRWRRSAGEEPYRGGFIDQYIEDVVYPDELTPIIWLLVGVSSLVSYGRLARKAGRSGRPVVA